MSFIDRYHERGFLTFKRVIDTALIDELRREYFRQFDAFDHEHAGPIGLKVGAGRFMITVDLAGPFLDARLYANPFVLAVVRALLGNSVLIDNLTCVSAVPGAELQHLHRDHAELFPEAPELMGVVKPYAMTLVVPLIDLTPETGTTMLYPGSHVGPRSEETELPFLQRGDCMLFDYRLEHQGMANSTAEQRPVIYIVYSRPWFTDIRNFGKQGRLNIAAENLHAVQVEHRPLFRRLAQKNAFNLTERELFAGL